MGVPVCLIGKESVRVGPQSFQWCVGQLLRLHISQGLFIDPVVLMARSQKSQKVDTALRLGAAKPGKQLITNVGGVSILAAMARTRVIYGEIARAGISCAGNNPSFSLWRGSCLPLSSASTCPAKMSMPHSRNCSNTNGWVTWQ